jgi:hypothetical protein
MRINASDVQFLFHSTYEDATEWQRAQSSSLTRTELDDGGRPLSTAVNVRVNLEDAYSTDTYSRVSSRSLVQNSSPADAGDKAQTHFEYEAVIQAAVQGLIEQQINVGMVLPAGDERAEQNLTVAVTDALELETDTDINVTSSREAGSGSVSASHLIVRQQRSYMEASQHVMSSSGTIELADGRSIEFTLELELQRHHQREGELLLDKQARTLIDPLVINLAGNPDILSSASFEFDMDSDGQVDTFSGLQQGVGFLALDRNDDGVINDGQELFGTQSGNGFDDLALYDSDRNGWIDESDDVFQLLQVWQPPSVDADGNSVEGRLLGLTEAGVGAIYLGSGEADVALKDEQNQLQAQIRRQGMFLTEEGDVGSIQQVDFARHELGRTSLLQQQFDELSDQLGRIQGGQVQGPIPLIERGFPVVDIPTQAEGLSLEEQLQAVIESNPWLQELAAIPRAQFSRLSSTTASDNFFNRGDRFLFVQMQQQQNQTATESVSVNRTVTLETLLEDSENLTDMSQLWQAQGPKLFESMLPYGSTAEGQLLEARAERTQQMIDHILRPMMEQYQLRRQLQHEKAAAVYQDQGGER